MRKREDYSRYLIIGLILTVLLALGLAFYALGERARLAQAGESFRGERIVRGGKIYNSQCVACHGNQGEGGVGPALNSRNLLKTTMNSVFFSVIRSGVPNTQMLAWSVDFGGPLTDENIRDVVSFIRDWEATAPEIKPVEFVSDPERGALIFASTCSICHGENGQGGKNAPMLNNLERLQSLPDDWYRSVIKNGRPAKGMPTWGTVLSPNQIEDLLALIDAWRESNSVQARFSVTDLLDSAIFSLQQGDNESAKLHVTRALQVAHGAGAQSLSEVYKLLIAGDTTSALTSLVDLRAQWPIGDAKAGEEAYNTNCAACHSEQGEGGIGKVLHPSPFIQSQTNAELVAFILQGRPGTPMAGFDGRLSEAEIANIIAYLRLWQK